MNDGIVVILLFKITKEGMRTLFCNLGIKWIVNSQVKRWYENMKILGKIWNTWENMKDRDFRVCLLLFKVNFWIPTVWFTLVFYNTLFVRIYQFIGKSMRNDSNVFNKLLELRSVTSSFSTFINYGKSFKFMLLKTYDHR